MKHLYSKIGSMIVATSLSINLFTLSASALATEIKRTNAVSSISTTETEDLFKNKELKEIIEKKLGCPITESNLKRITTLKINTKLADQDFSDLKYLTNLENLTIENNNINLKHLSNNLKLKNLKISNGTIDNIECIPESLEIVNLSKTKITGNILPLPPNVKTLCLNSLSVQKLVFSNPTKLTFFYYSSYEFLDLNNIKDCSNLKTITIRRSPNITNSEVLTTFRQVSSLNLDEHATLWLNKETLQKLNITDTNKKKNLLDLIDKLDELALSLNEDELSEREKINKIILYVIEQIKYDRKVYGFNDEAQKLAVYYNDCPISTSLESKKGVCVNYACLFKALANRMGIDNYQAANSKHTWNMIKLDTEDTYCAYDLTYLDSTPIIGIPSQTKPNYVGTYPDYEHDLEYYFDTNQEEMLYFYKFDYMNSKTSVYKYNTLPIYESLLGQSLDELVLDEGKIALLLNSFGLLVGVISNQINKIEKEDIHIKTKKKR